MSKAAHVDGYARIFCLKSSGGWRTPTTPSAVASIYPVEGATVYGAVVELNAVELAHLDTYEGGYTKTDVATSEGRAVAYIANNPTWTEHLPSEHYLTAIHCMLREHYSMDDQTIDIRAVLPGAAHPVMISRWSHPGTHKLSLEAFLVELNVARGGKWTMPTTILEVTGKLGAVGITSTPMLAKALIEGTLNDKLCAASQSPFNDDVRPRMRELLGV